jgi:hypothetical protein
MAFWPNSNKITLRLKALYAVSTAVLVAALSWCPPLSKDDFHESILLLIFEPRYRS